MVCECFGAAIGEQHHVILSKKSVASLRQMFGATQHQEVSLPGHILLKPSSKPVCYPLQEFLGRLLLVSNLAKVIGTFNLLIQSLSSKPNQILLSNPRRAA